MKFGIGSENLGLSLFQVRISTNGGSLNKKGISQFSFSKVLEVFKNKCALDAAWKFLVC